MAHKKKYVVGVDLGGTKILAVLYDKKFRSLAEIKTKTRAQKGEKHFLGAIRECVDSVMERAGVKRGEILGMGVGCPGIVDEKRGVILTSPNIAFLRSFPLGPKLARLFGFRVILGNDVKTGLYGEHQFGAAKGFLNVVGIFLGTGIGGAIMIDGKIYLGATDGAGEIGHVQVDPLGPRCGCGRLGCFEAIASRLGMASEAAVLAAKQKAPFLFEDAGTDILEIKSGNLARAIKSGDRAILDLIRRKARVVGAVMANLVNLLNPEVIVLGGGVVEALSAHIVKEAELTMREQAMGPLAACVKVAAAKLGDHSIVMGAAKRAVDAFAGDYVHA